MMLSTKDRWIWPFELTEKIGEGGMGVVYRARYVVNDKTVAVKLLPPDVTDETLLGRFEREVEILKTLRHPNIVHCFGGSCENKRRFYAMELVEGGTLEDLLRKRGRLPWELVAEFAKQMCAALAYAHERGIVHRDVKPANFLVTNEGKLKLSDFGLATLLAGRRITAAGRTAGTYEYMAPEQISGKALTSKTDLYALGCVLYELLCGEPPFQGAHSAEVLHAHLKKPAPRIAEKVPDCPAALDELISELMAKDPDGRPESADSVHERLRNLSPMIQVMKGSPRVGVSNRPTPAARKEPDDEVPPTVSASPPRRSLSRLPNWILPTSVGLVGLLAATWAAQRDDHGSLRLAVSELVKMTAPEEPLQVRLRAIQSLGQLSARSETAFDAVMKALESPEPVVRREAVVALRGASSSAMEIVPILQRLQREDDQTSVRSEVQWTIDAIREAKSRRRSWGDLLLITLFVVVAILAWQWKWKTA